MPSVFLCESLIISLIDTVVGIASGWVLASIGAIVFHGGGAFTGNQTVATGGGLTITPLLIPEVTILALVFGIGISAVFAL